MHQLALRIRHGHSRTRAVGPRSAGDEGLILDPRAKTDCQFGGLLSLAVAFLRINATRVRRANQPRGREVPCACPRSRIVGSIGGAT